MTTNIIKQIVSDKGDGVQSIKMIVRSNERGPQGEQGIPGEAATIEAGKAYTTPYGSKPAVMNRGTSSNAIFDFYIPQGKPGRDGGGGGGGGGGDAIWGDIIGVIEDQTDLQQEFGRYTPTEDLATVATTGSYDDLSDKPTIPAAQVNADWAASSGVAQILNKPTIPTVNNATLTIKKNGATVATFTANSATNTTANITAPTITATSTDPGEGSSLATDNYVAVYGDPIILDYSTSEMNTGIKWLDGSYIYRKSIASGALPNTATSKNVAHGIANLAQVIRIEGCYSDPNSGFVFPVNSPTLDVDSTTAIRTIINGSNIQINVGMDRSNCSGYVTLYYTKSS